MLFDELAALGYAQSYPTFVRKIRNRQLFPFCGACAGNGVVLDECPQTGRGRLSYERASTIFKQATGGWTLHQLRHSSLTHLGEKGASTILLQAKSRHQDPRTLAIYTNQETKQSHNSRPRLTNNGGLDEPPLWDLTLPMSGKR